MARRGSDARRAVATPATRRASASSRRRSLTRLCSQATVPTTAARQISKARAAIRERRRRVARARVRSVCVWAATLARWNSRSRALSSSAPPPSACPLLLGAAFHQVLRLGRGIRAGAVVAAVVACAALVPTALDLRTPESRSDDMTVLAAALRETTQPGDGMVYLSVKRRAWELVDSTPVAGADLARARCPVASHSLYGTEVAPDELRARMLAGTGSSPSPRRPASRCRTTPWPG
ncbi:hypothetical protein ACFVT5_13510 [Streptomyces sp. NPDC058001]|uniref:hypothetical protein n=1 Tax=Streptomyces sp. NPDC058001 TaxID=3346300 RepID=UPI0036DFBA80